MQWLDYDFYLADSEGKHSERLTDYVSDRVTSPRWSPDSKFVTFAALDKEGRTWLRKIDLDGKIEWEIEGKNNESMPFFVGQKLTIVSDRENVGRYRIGFLDPNKGTFTPITKEEGYFIDPQSANGKIYVLEDINHKMRFRISEIDPTTGAIKEIVPESEFDEPKKP